MRYDQFREQWERALHNAGLLASHHSRTETVDSATLDRQHEIVAGHDLPQRAMPFYVTAALSFRWDVFDSARSYTCEEDLLSELLGRRDRPTKTKPHGCAWT